MNRDAWAVWLVGWLLFVPLACSESERQDEKVLGEDWSGAAELERAYSEAGGNLTGEVKRGTLRTSDVFALAAAMRTFETTPAPDPTFPSFWAQILTGLELTQSCIATAGAEHPGPYHGRDDFHDVTGRDAADDAAEQLQEMRSAARRAGE